MMATRRSHLRTIMRLAKTLFLRRLPKTKSRSTRKTATIRSRLRTKMMATRRRSLRTRMMATRKRIVSQRGHCSGF